MAAMGTYVRTYRMLEHFIRPHSKPLSSQLRVASGCQVDWEPDTSAKGKLQSRDRIKRV